MLWTKIASDSLKCFQTFSFSKAKQFPWKVENHLNEPIKEVVKWFLVQLRRCCAGLNEAPEMVLSCSHKSFFSVTFETAINAKTLYHFIPLYHFYHISKTFDELHYPL